MGALAGGPHRSVRPTHPLGFKSKHLTKRDFFANKCSLKKWSTE
jgi:hypothetical protein